MLIWNRLKEHAAAQPEKIAVVCEDTRLTHISPQEVEELFTGTRPWPKPA